MGIDMPTALVIISVMAPICIAIIKVVPARASKASPNCAAHESTIDRINSIELVQREIRLDLKELKSDVRKLLDNI